MPADLARMIRCAVLLSIGILSSSQAQGKSCKSFASPPLKGETHLTRTSLPSVYDLKNFLCMWDVPAGVYWWYSPLKKGSFNPIYGGPSGNLTAEVGQGWWLTRPKYVNVSASRWNSHAFVATRVEAFNHTSCCCQIMSADSDSNLLWLTEYCRAIVKGLDKSPRDTCAPYASTPCPTDNASAWQQHWPLPPYSESYSACVDPLGTTIPKPSWLKAEYLAQTETKNVRSHSPNVLLYRSHALVLGGGVVALGGLLLAVAGYYSAARPLEEAYQVLPNKGGTKGRCWPDPFVSPDTAGGLLRDTLPGS